MNSLDIKNQTGVPANPVVSSASCPKTRPGWLSVIVISLLVSFGVSAVIGYFAGGQIGNLFNKNQVRGEIPGLTTTVDQVQEESAVISVVQKVQPAVVSIVVSKDMSKLYQNNFFSPFSFQLPVEEQGQMREIGGGTGFFLSNDGLVLTNRHVVSDDTAEYTVITQDGTRYDKVNVLARDSVNDMALLKVEGDNFPTVELGDSDGLKVGQTVIAIGNALGEYQNSVTAGIVSGLGRNITAGSGYGQSSERLTDIIQTDAAINSGNSGGPLVNLAGQVIGVNTAVDFSGQLVGFALPINTLKPAIQSVKDQGKIVRPYLGVRYVLLNEKIAKQNNLTVNYGALLLRGNQRGELAILPGSPADKAGLEENDIVLEIAGQKIDENHDLTAEINKYLVGDNIKLRVWHDGIEKEVVVSLIERPAN